jgi:hypothetical protein
MAERIAVPPAREAWEAWRDSPERPWPHYMRDTYYQGWNSALLKIADDMLDAEIGLPFDNDHDRAIVSAWVLEYADQTPVLEASMHEGTSDDEVHGG